MADLSDVESALSAFALSVVYANGLGAPSLTGKPTRVYRGWPVRGALDRDLELGIVNISVFAVPGATRNTTRWGTAVHTSLGRPSLTVAVTATSAVFGGTGGAGQLAGLLIDGQPFVHRLQDGDTAALVAAVLAETIGRTRVCWLSGTTLDVPGSVGMKGRVTADANVLTEWGRQEQGFRLSVWCPDPGSRDQVCSALGSAFAAQSLLVLADGTAGQVRYRSTVSIDDGQDAHLYRRDLLFDVEYGTTSVQSVASMLFGDLQTDDIDIYA